MYIVGLGSRYVKRISNYKGDLCSATRISRVNYKAYSNAMCGDLNSYRVQMSILQPSKVESEEIF